MVELRLGDHLYFHCDAKGRVQQSTHPVVAPCSDRLNYPLSLRENPRQLSFLRTDGGTFNQQDNALFCWIAQLITPTLMELPTWQPFPPMAHHLKQDNSGFHEQIRRNDIFHDIVCRSEAMKQVLMQLEMVAHSDSTVLLMGETGTGKEILAHVLHHLSPRSHRPMVKMNCAAIPASLLESDLFGHEKGAFTGATSMHKGRFEMAQGGTLLLDEIGDMPLELQPKLLRVLQEREIERLGSQQVIAVNVRVIAATNRDLQQMVVDRDFRNDLFYRLNVFPITIPPLRHRVEDIPVLAHFLMRKIAARMQRHIDTIRTDDMQQLCRYPWPGNVRELQNVIERAVILTRGHSLNIQLSELPATGISAPVQPLSSSPDGHSKTHWLQPAPPESDEQERQRILQVLRETNGIVAGPRGAAIKLGLKRTTLLSRMQRLGITPRDIL
ncbi:MAG: sigma-54 interaction domain-containing protein, partial [Enterobacteriaceae bacterium]